MVCEIAVKSFPYPREDVEHAPKDRQHRCGNTEFAGTHQEKGIAGVAQREDHQCEQVPTKPLPERFQRPGHLLGGGCLLRRFPKPESQEQHGRKAGDCCQKEQGAVLARAEPEEGCRQDWTNGCAQVIHRTVETEGPSSNLGSNGIGNEGISGRVPSSLADPIS